MNFKIKIDFCIIPGPYNNGLKNLIFISYRGKNVVDEKMCLEEDYELVKYIFGKYGYQEMDFCVFESSNNNTMVIEELKYKLTEAGMRYSKPFEFNIKGELESFNRDTISAVTGQEVSVSYPIDNNVYFSTTSPAIFNKSKTKIPEVGEKITLYFYLFLECHFINENDCQLTLIGDLYSKENTNTRNFLQITKSEFVRLDSNMPNSIILQSVKTYGDFINEVNILHKGNFKFLKPSMGQNGDMIMKSKQFVYNIMEVKKNIKVIHRIVVEANINQYFDSMMAVSKKIKKELSLEQKRIISLEEMRPEMLSLKNKLKDKMLTHAESDEFEKASYVKNDINFIENKIEIIDKLEEKNITREEYFKTFCLNS